MRPGVRHMITVAGSGLPSMMSHFLKRSAMVAAKSCGPSSFLPHNRFVSFWWLTAPQYCPQDAPEVPTLWEMLIWLFCWCAVGAATA